VWDSHRPLGLLARLGGPCKRDHDKTVAKLEQQRAVLRASLVPVAEAPKEEPHPVVPEMEVKHVEPPHTVVPRGRPSDARVEA